MQTALTELPRQPISLLPARLDCLPFLTAIQDCSNGLSVKTQLRGDRWEEPANKPSGADCREISAWMQRL